MPQYNLYQSDNVTVIATAQPANATWERTGLAPFANGTPRYAKYKRVVWQIPRMTSDQYLVFTSNRPASGAMTFKTYRPPFGATAGAWVKCTGIMREIVGGTEFEGEYYGVEITFDRVLEV